MDRVQLDRWFSRDQQYQIISRLINRVGLTRVRAECFVRLWVYLLVKHQQSQRRNLTPPLQCLVLPSQAVSCTHREAATLFYSDRDQGSDRSAGMMLDKLATLGLIKKTFDGNTTTIEIQPIPEVLDDGGTEDLAELILDDFDPRSDAIPIANLLATNYNWMNRNVNATSHRIARLLRGWARQYARGMRVLRRCDNDNPVGFYLLYPTASESEVNFSSSPSKALHLSGISEVDPFQMAAVGDPDCVSVFVRSWMIDSVYLDHYRIVFLEDAQQQLRQMQQDFPNLCDLHTLLIHPNYEEMALALGFQKTSRDSQLSIYWMYQALDRFLALNIKKTMLRLSNKPMALA